MPNNKTNLSKLTETNDTCNEATYVLGEVENYSLSQPTA